jgi:hypothetical protein
LYCAKRNALHIHEENIFISLLIAILQGLALFEKRQVYLTGYTILRKYGSALGRSKKTRWD